MKTSHQQIFSLLLILASTSPIIAQSEAENNAYRLFYNEKDAQKKLELGEKYLIEFKESTYRSPILQTMLALYVQSQNWTKVMEHTDRLPIQLPTADAKTKAAIYTYAMAAAQATNNSAKIVEYGDNILAIDPNNLQAQISVATTIPAANPQDKAANDKAFDLASKALVGVAEYFKQPKPADMSDAQWAQARAEYDDHLHSALGLIYFNRLDYQKSAEEFQIVLKNNPQDGVAHFYLGLAYRNLAAEASKALLEVIKALDTARVARASQPEIDELDAQRQGMQDDFQQIRDMALDELAIAVAIGGPAAREARDALEKLYLTKNNDSLSGLEEFIATKKNALR